MFRLSSCRAPLGALALAAALAAAPLPADEPKPASLKYKVIKGPGGTLAAFDGWQTAAVPGGAWFATLSAPKGRTDFALLLAFSTPDKKHLDKLFDGAAAAQLKSLLPGLKPAGKATVTRFAGDEARAERWQGTSTTDGKARVARVVYLKKKDVAVILVGLGTEAGVKELGEAVDIAAKSLSFIESKLEPGLAGTWSWSTSSSAGGLTMSASKLVTITADGKFTWRNSGVGTGDGRLATFSYLRDGTMKGQVIRRGAVLTFHADDGRRWSLTYQLKGNNGVDLGGQLFAKE